MEQTKLIIVGGFLGAGKTTLLRRAAEHLGKKGERVGLITNDQAANLVDTMLLEKVGEHVEEVSGSCFCCNFPGFADALMNIREAGCTTVVAEPVGSCTDLSATILQPIKDKYTEKVDLAPMTVAADPERLTGILDGVYSTASYIVTKQFDEADLILINKADLLSEEALEELVRRTKERWQNAEVMTASAKDDEGIDAWLAAVLGSEKAGTHLATVDYDKYADGEAAYGWLNAAWQFASEVSCGKDEAEKLLQLLRKGLADADIAIGHVKFLLATKAGAWMGNLTGTDEGTIQQVAGQEVYQLMVNARAETGPKILQDIVLAAMNAVFASEEIVGTEMHTLIPGRPNPTWHYKEVVA